MRRVLMSQQGRFSLGPNIDHKQGAKMSRSDDYINFIFSRIEDKAFRTAFKHADNEAFIWNAYPYIRNFVNIENETDARLYVLIGSAIIKSGQKENGKCGLGNAFWRIYNKNYDSTEFPPRFKRILAADNLDEILSILRPSLALIRSKDIPLDFKKLLSELNKYRFDGSRNQVRAAWASDYFNKGEEENE